MGWTSRFDEEALQRALEEGRLNEVGQDGATPLWHATWFGRADWVRRLLEAGADPDAHDPARIDEGAGDGHVVSIWQGLPEHADLSIAGRGTLIHVAASRAGDAEVLDVLLQWGLLIDGRDRFGSTALHIATFAGKPLFIAALLHRGADPNLICAAGYAPIDHAPTNAELVRLLLGGGARPGGGPKIAWFGRSYEWSLLTQAASWGNKEVVEQLIAAGARPADNAEALGRSAIGGHVGVLRALLSAGADAFARAEHHGEMRMPLEMAALGLSLACVEALLPHNRKCVDRAMEATLWMADYDPPGPPNDKRHQRMAILRRLIEGGADPSLALSAAAELKDPDFASMLLEASADPDALDAHGRTPLHRASARGCYKVARLLLEAGASSTRLDPMGRTPWQIATEALDVHKINDARMILHALRAAGAAPPEAPEPPSEPALAVGVEVHHKTFGRGRVKALKEGGVKAVVVFDLGGEKTLMARFLEF